MRGSILILLFVSIACQLNPDAKPVSPSEADAANVESLIYSLYRDLTKAYNGANLNTDSLMEAYFKPDIYYVTPWGWTEPLDTTKARLRNARAHIKDYENRIESLRVKVYGDGAYAFFVLRQNYTVDGHLLEEYLPTTFMLERLDGKWKIVHVQRSTDYETMQQYIALQNRQK